MKPSITIGTAQFGLNYGVTNVLGKLSKRDIKKILTEAIQEDIFCLDTASVYGDSDKNIGEITGKENKFKILGKFPGQQDKNKFTKRDVELWESTFNNSLMNLNKKKFDTYFLHNTNDLRKEGSNLLSEWLLGLKERKLVDRLGCSIYEKSDLNSISNQFLEVVQLPLSIYNQKLLNDGTISLLKKKNVSIHLRSIFLQGLLLTKTEHWPYWVGENEKKHHLRFCNFAKKINLDLTCLCLDFAKKIDGIDSIILGFSSLAEFREVCRIWRQDSNLREINIDYKKWEIFNNDFIDPRNWPK